MSSLSTLPKGDSAWLLRKAVQRIMQQVSVLETNIGSSTTGNSANTQVIFNDAGTLRGDAGLTYNAATDTLTAGSATITGDLTVRTNRLIVNSNGTGIGTTPSAWGPGTRGFELANGAVISFAGYIGTVGVSNSYYDGSNWIYKTTYGAARYDQENGSHIWFNAPSGTAGNTVGWSTAMTLNSTGLGVGISPSYKLNIGAANPTSGNIAQFYNNAASSLNGAFCLITQFGVQDWYMGQPAGVSAFTIGTGATSKSEFFRIDGSGNVGIGVTPVSKLTVSGGVSLTSAASNHFLRDGTAWIWSSDGASTGTARGGLYADGSSNLNLYGGSTLASHLQINSSGDVISKVNTSVPTVANSQMVFNLTTNTNLRITVRGTDGTLRSANITLAP